MTDASNDAYRLAWARFADLMKEHGPIEAAKLLRAADAEAFNAMAQWMQRQPLEEREQLAILFLDPSRNA